MGLSALAQEGCHGSSFRQLYVVMWLAIRMIQAVNDEMDYTLGPFTTR